MHTRLESLDLLTSFVYFGCQAPTHSNSLTYVRMSVHQKLSTSVKDYVYYTKYVMVWFLVLSMPISVLMSSSGKCFRAFVMRLKTDKYLQL